MSHRMKQYRMEYNGKGLFTAATLLGFSLFLRVLFYFGFTEIESVEIKEIILFLGMPALFDITFIVLLRGIRLKQTLVFGILGALYFLLLTVQCFQYGDLLGMILSVCFYVICGALFVVISLGLLSKEIGVTACAATAVMRLVFSGVLFRGIEMGLAVVVAEVCTFFVLCSLSYMIFGFKE